jgi:hypothetical protein
MKPAMDEKFQIILSSLPEKPPRSRLEPFRELIEELRERGRTYQEIAQILTEKCQVATSRSAVNDFVRVRRRRKLSKQPTARPEESNKARSTGAGPPSAVVVHGPSNEEVWKRIEEMKRRPPPCAEPSKEFHYNPDEPLHMPDATKKGRAS